MQLADIILPKITHENKPVKFVWKGRHIIMYPALGDQQAALLGSGLHNSKQLSINMGTGAQVSVVSDSPSLSGAYQTRPYFAGKYLLTVPHIPSGRALNVYFRFVREIFDRADENITDYEIWEWINNEVEKQDGTLTMDLSFFPNAISETRKGYIKNIGEYDFTISNLFASVFGKMADNVQECVRRICPDMSEVAEIIFAGGVAVKNMYLREKIANHFPSKKCRVAVDETFLGIAQYIQQNQ